MGHVSQQEFISRASISRIGHQRFSFRAKALFLAYSYNGLKPVVNGKKTTFPYQVFINNELPFPGL
jgi:hypothetical protein